MLTLRKSLLVQTRWQAQEKIDLKPNDTTSKFGHGCFPTALQSWKKLLVPGFRWAQLQPLWPFGE